MTAIVHDGQRYRAFLAGFDFSGKPSATVKVCPPGGGEQWETIQFPEGFVLRDEEGALYPAAEDLACQRAVEQADSKQTKVSISVAELEPGGSLYGAMFGADPLESDMGEAFFDRKTSEVFYENQEAFISEKPPADLNENARYIHIPHYEEDAQSAWARMRDFADSREDEDLRAELMNAIQGSGAFGRFRAIVEGKGLRGEWEAFKDEESERRQLLLDWCAEHGIEVG